jgi:hypothetical protein
MPVPQKSVASKVSGLPAPMQEYPYAGAWQPAEGSYPQEVVADVQQKLFVPSSRTGPSAVHTVP